MRHHARSAECDQCAVRRKPHAPDELQSLQRLVLSAATSDGGPESKLEAYVIPLRKRERDRLSAAAAYLG